MSDENLNAVDFDFDASFGEDLNHVLDIDNWATALDLAGLYDKLAQEISVAVQLESAVKAQIRQVVFPQLKARHDAPTEAGVYQATDRDIERVHSRILFNGAVESCDGNSLVDDRLPLTITQIGVSLVSYSGQQGTWVHRLFRHDLRQRSGNPVDEALQLLENRSTRGAIDQEVEGEQISALARRGIMAYAERAILLGKSSRPWRMGHGNPAPYEILTGSGDMRLLEKGLLVLRSLLLGHRRFVFVPSTTALRGRLFPTIGNALRPLEYAVIDSTYESMRRVVENGHYAKKYRDLAMGFVEDAGHEILIGAYRASSVAPGQVFFGHRDHIHEAALIAMADSVLQEHRGFPMLIDLADTSCRSMMGADGFGPTVETAYVEAGAPFAFSAERSTRRS